MSCLDEIKTMTLKLLKKIPDKPNNKILILCGDVPFISAKSLNIMIKKLDKSDLCIGTFNQVNPTGYGRIVREDNKIRRIIEEKDASPEQRNIHEINTGIIAAPGAFLMELILQIKLKLKLSMLRVRLKRSKHFVE